MAGGLTVSVRQIASYPALSAPNLSAADLVLVQQGGQGGPYASVSVGTLISAGLLNGPSMGIGLAVPANASGGQPGGQLFASNIVLPQDGARFWNAYTGAAGAPEYNYLLNGTAGAEGFNDALGFVWEIAPAGVGGQALVAWRVYMQLTQAGNLSLPLGTLSVARDPASALEVATMQWVGANTVASFNGRRGAVTLSAADVYGALCLDPCDPFITQSQAGAMICAGVAQGLAMTSIVNTFNGRLGNVFLNTCDLNIATFTGPPSQLPPLMVPTPPLSTATPAPDPATVVNIEWVETYLGTTAGFATEAWVTEQINNALLGTVSSFNGRSGVVSLLLADVTGVGGAPLQSPDFSGIPSAPTATTGTSTSQIATTAFVMNTLTALTPGVVSFNGRAGTVTLNSTDINNAGGALLASPNFTGVPAAPTAAQGTSTSQIATTAFVMSEIAASTAGVVSFNGRSGIVTLTLADIEAAGGAPQASPALTGIPTAPTAANGTSTTQLATTAFVMNEIGAISAGVTTWNGRSGAVSLTQNDVTAVGGLVNPSPGLTGTPTAPTPAPTDSSTNIATTAFVHNLLAAYAGASVGALPPASPNTGSLWFNTSASPNQLNVWNGSAWVVTTNTSGYAPLASPALSGTPTAPTAGAGTNSQQIATTAFVTAAIAALPTQPQPGTALPLMNGTAAAGTSLLYSRQDHIHPTDTSRFAVTGGTITGSVNATGSIGANLPGGAIPGGAASVFGSFLAAPANTGSGQGINLNLLSTAPQSYWVNGPIGVIQASGSGILFNAYPSAAAGAQITAAPASMNWNWSQATGWGALMVNGLGNFGGTSVIGSPGFTSAWGIVQIQQAVSNGACLALGSTATGAIQNILFGSSYVGNIAINGSGNGVTYNTTSDARLKTNVSAITNAGSLIDALNPVTFNWTTGSQAEDWGFIAQDVNAVFPAAVMPGSDGTLGEPGVIPWSMDEGKLMSLVIAALKALRHRVAALEAQLNVAPAVPVTQ